LKMSVLLGSMMFPAEVTDFSLKSFSTGSMPPQQDTFWFVRFEFLSPLRLVIGTNGLAMQPPQWTS
jgi:hypothetical protein